jgi:dipeptide transport system substrate-binding protein
MAMDFASIVSKEYADAMMEAGTPEMVNQAPIGTGPFSFAAFQPDVALRYRAFPAYWGGRTPISSLVF